MVRKVAVQITKLVLVLSLAAFVVNTVTPVRGARYFAVLIGSVLVFLICLFLLKKLGGDNTSDRFYISLMKVLNKLSGRNTGAQP
jgi:hypothetical protein